MKLSRVGFVMLGVGTVFMTCSLIFTNDELGRAGEGVLVFLSAALLLTGTCCLALKVFRNQGRTLRLLEDQSRRLQQLEVSQGQFGSNVRALLDIAKRTVEIETISTPKSELVAVDGSAADGIGTDGENLGFKPAIQGIASRGAARASRFVKSTIVLGLGTNRIQFEETDCRKSGGRTEHTITSAGAGTDVIPLAREGAEFELEISSGAKITIELDVRVQDGNDPSNKGAVFWVEAYDQDDKILQEKILQSGSDRFQNYKYLDLRGASVLSFVVPDGSTSLRAGIVPWDNKVAVHGPIEVTESVPQKFQIGEKTPGRLRVAVLLDEFSYNSFKYEFEPIVVEPEDWLERFETSKPDLFFCESAWSGEDSKRRPWKGKVYASVNFERENRNELLAIIAYCKSHSIPTVFWNKEDPNHFDDRVHDFVKTAIEFDYIFTTDEGCVERYKSEYGHPSVHTLQFGVQPRIFNPSNDIQRTNDVVFAGSWYENHIERSKNMVKIFDSILESGRGLKIYDRYFGDSDPLHFYPNAYKPYVNPSVPYEEVPRVYKESLFGLSINTETQSQTMFARRIFELMASNTFVVSNYSKGIDSTFPGRVIFLDKEPDGLETISDQAIERIRRENLIDVLKNHTYRRRFAELLEVVGLKGLELATEISTVVARVSDASQVSTASAILRGYGSAKNRILLLGSEMEGTAAAKVFQTMNSAHIRVIAEPLLLTGKIDPDEGLGGPGPTALIWNLDVDPDESILNGLALHCQYSDKPVVEAADSEKRYRSQPWEGENIVLPNSEAMVASLEKISTNQEIDCLAV